MRFFAKDIRETYIDDISKIKLATVESQDGKEAIILRYEDKEFIIVLEYDSKQERDDQYCELMEVLKDGEKMDNVRKNEDFKEIVDMLENDTSRLREANRKMKFKAIKDFKAGDVVDCKVGDVIEYD